MLRGDEEDRVGALDLRLEAGDGGRDRLFLVLVVHGQVVDLDEFGLESVGPEAAKCLRQLAIDGFAAVGADDDSELVLGHGNLYLYSVVTI